jgi:hypothetical protein
VSRLSALLVFALGASAQTPDTATIHGHVTDQSRAAVPGVQIKLTNALTTMERTAQTDASGSFSLEGLPIAGTYTVTATKQGFAEARVGDLTLAGGTTADLNLQLSAAGGQTLINVTGIAGEVRTDQPQLGTHLDSAQIEETPLPSRRITYLPLLNAANRPAINQGDVFMNQDLFTSNGAGRRQAWLRSMAAPVTIAGVARPSSAPCRSQRCRR